MTQIEVQKEPVVRRASPMLLLLLAGVLVLPLVGSPDAAASELGERVRAFRQPREKQIVGELVELLRIPNVATDETTIRRNAQHLQALLSQRGVKNRLLESPGSPPAVLGELRSPGAQRTVVFYAHYDGQPVDPARWQTDPWQPRLRGGLEADATTHALTTVEALDPEWRLFARSASDDKAPIIALLVALDALRELEVTPSVNLLFFFEGEEEQGSPHLAEMLQSHRELLDADLWLFCDGPVHQSRRQQVVFGVRGVMDLEVEMYGPIRPLHSGHYGNWAPNPGALLVHLIAQLRDTDGRILIEGFYDDAKRLTAADREALASVPMIDDELRYAFALAASEANNAPLIERIMLPALNVKGIEVGKTGAEAKNAIASSARASLGFRLVPDQTPEKVRSRVERHLRDLGYTLIYEEPDLDTRRQHKRLVRMQWNGGYRAMRTALDHPASLALLQVADEALGERVVRMPILGGSLPMYLFEEILQTPLIVLPMVNHDNNQHAPDENLRLQNLWDGIELYAQVMARLGEVW